MKQRISGVQTGFKDDLEYYIVTTEMILNKDEFVALIGKSKGHEFE